jgi:hypothetical protein
VGDEIEYANVIRVQAPPIMPGFACVEWIVSLGPAGRGAIHAVGQTPEAAVRKLLDRLPASWPWDETWHDKGWLDK